MTGVSKEQREILGPAWDLLQQIERTESQWRETAPDLVETCVAMRNQLIREVNVKLHERGGAPIAEMES